MSLSLVHRIHCCRTWRAVQRACATASCAPCSALGGLLALIGLASAVLPNAGQAQEAPGLQPMAVPAPRTRQDTPWSAEVMREADNTSQAVLWRSLGRLSLGLGMQRRPLSGPGSELRLGGVPERDSSDLLLGIALRTGRQSRLMLQSSPAELLRAEPPEIERQPRTLVLQSSGDPYRALRRGVLRMELDRDSALGLRLRKRQMMLQYNLRW